MIKAADMLIARRADTRARADFATWKMMAKLNGSSALPAEAQDFLDGYKALLDTDGGGRGLRGHHSAHLHAAITAEMGGSRRATATVVARQANGSGDSDNVTAFRRPAPQPIKTVRQSGPATNPGFPWR